LSTRLWKGDDVNLSLLRFVGEIGKPFAVRRYPACAFVELGLKIRPGPIQSCGRTRWSEPNIIVGFGFLNDEAAVGGPGCGALAQIAPIDEFVGPDAPDRLFVNILRASSIGAETDVRAVRRPDRESVVLGVKRQSRIRTASHVVQ